MKRYMDLVVETKEFPIVLDMQKLNEQLRS